MSKETDKKYLEIMIPLIEKGKIASEIIRETGLGKNIVYRLFKQYMEERKDNENSIIINIEKKDDIPLLSKEEEEEEDFVRQTIFEIKKTQDSELDTARQFIDFLKYPNELINNLQTNYEIIGKMNIEMQKLLHELEECETENALYDVSKKLFLLRKERRVIKNRYRLGHQLRHIFSNNRTHSINLFNISDIFSSVIDSIENYKNYTKDYDEDPPIDEEKEQSSRYEETKTVELDDWQKQVAQIMNSGK